MKYMGAVSTWATRGPIEIPEPLVDGNPDRLHVAIVMSTAGATLFRTEEPTGWTDITEENADGIRVLYKYYTASEPTDPGILSFVVEGGIEPFEDTFIHVLAFVDYHEDDIELAYEVSTDPDPTNNYEAPICAETNSDGFMVVAGLEVGSNGKQYGLESFSRTGYVAKQTTTKRAMRIDVARGVAPAGQVVQTASDCRMEKKLTLHIPGLTEPDHVGSFLESFNAADYPGSVLGDTAPNGALRQAFGGWVLAGGPPVSFLRSSSSEQRQYNVADYAPNALLNMKINSIGGTGTRRYGHVLRWAGSGNSDLVRVMWSNTGIISAEEVVDGSITVLFQANVGAPSNNELSVEAQGTLYTIRVDDVQIGQFLCARYADSPYMGWGGDNVGGNGGVDFWEIEILAPSGGTGFRDRYADDFERETLGTTGPNGETMQSKGTWGIVTL